MDHEKLLKGLPSGPTVVCTGRLAATTDKGDEVALLVLLSIVSCLHWAAKDAGFPPRLIHYFGNRLPRVWSTAEDGDGHQTIANFPFPPVS